MLAPWYHQFPISSIIFRARVLQLQMEVLYTEYHGNSTSQSCATCIPVTILLPFSVSQDAPGTPYISPMFQSVGMAKNVSFTQVCSFGATLSEVSYNTYSSFTYISLAGI